MITVEVIVPVLNQNYDFRLDEAAKISSLLEEMLEMLCRKEKRHVPESFDSFSLGYVDGGILLHRDASLRDYQISNGAQLILI
uniref:EsaB/YukD family protein n=1 Tax=uncultured Flavonifractor sp. TaxID=1193534 RepID=UPI00262B524B|nr:EsaB/YukD family protein [uncultured Flavonifractor sp.]